MTEDAKTYVFGNSDSSMAPWLAAMNNGGFGGNNAWWPILFLAALWGGNGFGGFGGGSVQCEYCRVTGDYKVLDEKVIIDNNGYSFELNGEKILFDGYLIKQ